MDQKLPWQQNVVRLKTNHWSPDRSYSYLCLLYYINLNGNEFVTIKIFFFRTSLWGQRLRETALRIVLMYAGMYIYTYILLLMYVFYKPGCLFSWSSNTFVILSMPAWPTFMWVMNDMTDSRFYFPIIIVIIKKCCHITVTMYNCRKQAWKLSGSKRELS